MRQLNTDEIKQYEYNILKAFAAYCKENNLTYMLCGGTLLGAVRHEGFIPWDDDIDVFMPREDFEKFIAMTGKNPFHPDYDTCYYKDTEKTVYYPFVKIINNKTKVFEKTKDESNYMGIWIDVFPLDGFYDSAFMNKLFCFRKAFWKKMCFTYSDDLSKVDDKAKRFFKTLCMPFLKKMGYRNLLDKLVNICSKRKFSEQKNVGCAVWGYGYKEIISKEKLLPAGELKFVDQTFAVPSDFDLYLSNLYGSYMELPPEEKRVNHEMKAFEL